MPPKEEWILYICAECGKNIEEPFDSIPRRGRGLWHADCFSAYRYMLYRIEELEICNRSLAETAQRRYNRGTTNRYVSIATKTLKRHVLSQKRTILIMRERIRELEEKLAKYEYLRCSECDLKAEYPRFAPRKCKDHYLQEKRG